MNTSHRPLRPEDAPILCRFPQSAEELFFMFPKAHWPFTGEQLLEAASRRWDPTVVEMEGRPAAYANFARFEEGRFVGIGNVVVAPQARGRGIGRFLIETMTAKGFAHGVNEVRVSCHSSNAAGLLMYASLGFEPFGIEKVGDWKGGRAALIHFRKRAPELRLSDLLGETDDDEHGGRLIPFPKRQD